MEPLNLEEITASFKWMFTVHIKTHAGQIRKAHNIQVQGYDYDFAKWALGDKCRKNKIEIIEIKKAVCLGMDFAYWNNKPELNNLTSEERARVPLPIIPSIL